MQKHRDAVRWAQLRLGFCLGLLCLSGMAHGGATPWVEFRLDDGVLEVPSVVNGVAGWSLLDSGAALNGINAAFVEAHGLDANQGDNVTLLGAFGRDRRRTWPIVPAEVMGIPLQFEDVVEVNHGDATRQLIVGSGFFQRAIFQFDFPNQRMRLLTRDTVDFSKVANTPARVERGTGRVQVQVRVNDEMDLWVLLDTGANTGLLMERKPAREAGWLDAYPAQAVETQGATRYTTLEYLRVPTLRFGPYGVTNALVAVPLDGHKLDSIGQRKGPRHFRRNRKQGILGLSVMRHFVVTIDYREGLVHVDLPREQPQGD